MGKGGDDAFKAKVARKFERGDNEKQVPGSGSVLGCAISPDDKIAASCCSDKKIILWDINADEPLGVLEGHEAEVTCCSFSDELLASGCRDGKIILWKYKLNPVKRASRIVVHSGAINAISISPSGQFLASASEDGTARIFAIRSGNGEFIQGPQSRTLIGHEGSVNDVAFSSDSQAVVTCSNDGHCKIWDTITGECLVTLEGKGPQEKMPKLLHCAFKRDGRQIVTMTRMCVSVWSLSKKAIAWEIEDKEGKGFTTLVCHPTTSLFALVGMDGTICGYNMSSKGQAFQTHAGHNGSVLCLAFSASGKLAVTGGIDGKTNIWI